MIVHPSLNPFSRTHEVLSQHLKQWAFTVSLDGDSVQVHHPGNVEYVKRLLKQAGLEQVRVRFLTYSIGRRAATAFSSPR